MRRFDWRRCGCSGANLIGVMLERGGYVSSLSFASSVAAIAAGIAGHVFQAFDVVRGFADCHLVNLCAVWLLSQFLMQSHDETVLLPGKRLLAGCAGAIAFVVVSAAVTTVVSIAAGVLSVCQGFVYLLPQEFHQLNGGFIPGGMGGTDGKKVCAWHPQGVL